MAQINGRDSLDIKTLTKYDLEYIEKYSFLLDSEGTRVSKNKKDVYGLYSSDGNTQYVNVSNSGTDILNGLFINGNAAQFALKNNYTAIADPVANDTYDIGSFWLNTINDTLFVCLEKGPALWKKMAYNDDLSGFVSLTATETIAGIKTFSGQTNFSSNVNLQYANPKIILHDFPTATKYEIITNTSGLSINNTTALNELDIVNISNNGIDIKNNTSIMLNGTKSVFKSSMAGIVDPNNTNDNNQNYDVGSVFINTATNTKFTCTDNTTNAARWHKDGDKNVTFQDFNTNSGTYVTVCTWLTGQNKQNFYDIIISPNSAICSVRIYNLSTASVEAELLNISGLPQIVSIAAVTPYFSNPNTSLQLQCLKSGGAGSLNINTLRIR